MNRVAMMASFLVVSMLYALGTDVALADGGAESVATQIRVAAAVETANRTTPAAEMPVRQRPLMETAGLIALFGALSGLGLFLARTATRTPVSS